MPPFGNLRQLVGDLLVEDVRAALAAVAPRRFQQAQLLVVVTVAVGDVGRRVFLDILIAPLVPALTAEAREKFEIWPRRAGFDHVQNLVRLARVLALSGSEHVHVGTQRVFATLTLPYFNQPLVTPFTEEYHQPEIAQSLHLLAQFLTRMGVSGIAR